MKELEKNRYGIMHKKIIVILLSEPRSGGEHQYISTIMNCLLEVEYVEISAICGNRFWKKWCKQNGVKILDISWYSFTEEERKIHLKFPIYSRIYCMYMTEFGKLLREEKTDAVLAMTQGVFVPNLAVKVISPVHDLMHRYEGHFPEVSSGYEGREQIFSSKAKFAWCVLTDSKVGRQQFLESYSEYMRNGHPHVAVLPFVVPEHIATCREEALAVPSKYVFYPAQFWQHKNHLNLLKAIEMLVDKIPDIHVVLVGSEKNNLSRVNNYIAEKRLEGQVTIMGFVSDENITYLYRHAVGMVMPSYFGPTNIPPLEAMALGCPVAVSNKYAMPEQVGDAGLLFDPDSPEEIAGCIKRMWYDNALREEMVKKGYRQVGKWTETRFRKRLEYILEKV